MKCIVDDCDKRAKKTSRYCSMHQGRMTRLGEIELPSRMPVAPLVELVEAAGGVTECGARKFSPLARRYYRAKERGDLSAQAADDLALAMLNRHPAEVWGLEWFRGTDT